MDKARACDTTGREFDRRPRHPKLTIFVSHLIVPMSNDNFNISTPKYAQE